MRINTDRNCNIVVTDDTEYPINGFEYSETASLYIALLNKSNSSTILYNKLHLHKNSDGNSFTLEPLENGFITICHIILPIVDNIDNYNPMDYIDKYVKVKNYIKSSQINRLFGEDSGEEEAEDEDSDDDDSDISGGYFTDGVNIYFKNVRKEVREVEIQELVEVNPLSFGILKFTQNFFSVCYLRKCYISLCLKIFKDREFDRCFNEKVNSLLIYKRDLVWAALNIIQYMIDSNQLAEAQRLLERINGCNGLCSREDTGDKGCGCE